MGQKARLDSLPEVKEELDRMVEENRYTQQQIADFMTDYANELGYDVKITKRIVQRHSANQKKAKEELKRHEEVTKQVVKHIGNVSLGNMGKGIAAIVGNIAFQVISDIDVNAESDAEKKPMDKVGMIKDLVSIAKGLNETAAISLSNEIKQEVIDKKKRGEKIIPHEELDLIYEEQLQQQAELQARIVNRKKLDTDNDYLEPDE